MTKPFAYRGFMLDSARHFMPVKDVCRLIEAAAICGMNRMHWHLTDDQGWRLEIKKYPLLTQIGSVRGDSYFGSVSPTENNCGFYTQEDVGRVVAFARERGIEIVPEIEVPGHASAMLAAYPQYGCRRMLPGGETENDPARAYPYQVITWAGVFPNLICAGRDDAVQFLLDILDEVTKLFPGPEVHIGGDEAVKMHWRRCPDCQRRIREEKLKDEHGLQRWLVLKCGEFLAQKGKKTMVWNESLQGGSLPKHFIVQHWLGDDQETAAFMESGGQVVCSDVGAYYISRLYSYTDAHDIWAAPLIPAYAKGHEENLLGLECPLWTERITNTQRAAYLLFPRLPAVAIKAQRKEALSWEQFCASLADTQKRIEALGLIGAPKELWQMSQADREKEQQEEQALRQSPRMQRVFEINDGMLLQDALENLLRRIDMPWEFALWIMDCAWAGQTPFSGGIRPKEDRGAQEAADQLLKAIENRQNGPWRDLPQDIMIDTLKCFSRFVREYHASLGEYGFDRGFWTTRQISAKLFRIGELEYELLEENGKPILSLHIPSDARLEAPLLDASVQKAREFLGRFFPKWQHAPIHCESWLLSPELRELLPPSARILRFQSAFDASPCPGSALGDALQWVYRLTPEQQKNAKLSALTEETALQRSMKQFLLSGRQLHAGSGLLSRTFSSDDHSTGGCAD